MRDLKEQTLSLPWILIATPQLTDAPFLRTVVLVVEHGANGTMGFVINRPVDRRLQDLVSQPGLEIPPEVPAWYGGPVGGGTGIILHRHPKPEPAVTQVVQDRDLETGPGIVLSSSQETLADLVDWVRHAAQGGLGRQPGGPDAPHLYPYRFLVGYAGWARGQLAEELRQGVWLAMPLSERLVFNTSWKVMWEEALIEAGASVGNLIATPQRWLN